MAFQPRILSVSTTAQNINASPANNNVVWDGTVFTDLGFAHAGTTAITIDEQGFYRISCGLTYQNALNNNVSFTLRAEHDIGAGFVDIGPQGDNGTLSNNNNTQNSLSCPTFIRHYNTGDQLRFSVDRESGNNSATTLFVGASVLTIELIRW